MKMEILDPESAAELNLPVLAGHQVNIEEWNFFEAYCRDTGKGAKGRICEKLGISPRKYAANRRAAWFMMLWNHYARGRQMDVYRDMMDDAEVFGDAMVQVARGDNMEEDRTAAARVNAAKLFFQLGPEPLLETRNQTNIQQNNFGGQNSINVAELAGKSSDELLRLATGRG